MSIFIIRTTLSSSDTYVLGVYSFQKEPYLSYTDDLTKAKVFKKIETALKFMEEKGVHSLDDDEWEVIELEVVDE